MPIAMNVGRASPRFLSFYAQLAPTSHVEIPLRRHVRQSFPRRCRCWRRGGGRLRLPRMLIRICWMFSGAGGSVGDELHCRIVNASCVWVELVRTARLHRLIPGIHGWFWWRRLCERRR